jgi:hypothetical protein
MYSGLDWNKNRTTLATRSRPLLIITGYLLLLLLDQVKEHTHYKCAWTFSAAVVGIRGPIAELLSQRRV